jgi:predicted PurR-regulated permease PerM
VPIYTFFFLLEMHRMTDAVVQRVPLSFRPQAVRILAEIQQAISSFFRGRVLICMIDAALSCVAFYICGVRFWFLLGLVTGALGIVPIVGPIAAFVPTAIISVIDYGLVRLLVVTLCFWGVQALDGLALTPLILGAKVRLHPVTLIISLLVGGHLFGVFGVLAAVPVVCILKILGKEFVLPQLRMALSEAVPAPPAGGSETP